MVALTGALSPATRAAKRSTLSACQNASRPPAQRLTREAPRMASRVLPAAMAAEVTGLPAVVWLTTKAPTSTPGQTP